jgi:hypothetical protein
LVRQAVTWLVGWLVGQFAGHLVGWSDKQSLGRVVGQFAGHLVRQAVTQSVGQSLSQLPIRWLVGQSVIEPARWSVVGHQVHQLFSHLARWLVGQPVRRLVGQSIIQPNGWSGGQSHLHYFTPCNCNDPLEHDLQSLSFKIS